MNLIRLNEILAMGDPYGRREELLKYARALGINTDRARRDDGTFNEEKLTVLIFDAVKQGENKGRRLFSWTAGAAAAGTALFVMVLVLPGVVSRFYSKVREPSEYHLMHGIYEKYDEEGRVLYEYRYDNGVLISRKEFDKNGKVVAEDVFNPPRGE